MKEFYLDLGLLPRISHYIFAKYFIPKSEKSEIQNTSGPEHFRLGLLNL